MTNMLHLAAMQQFEVKNLLVNLYHGHQNKKHEGLFTPGFGYECYYRDHPLCLKLVLSERRIDGSLAFVELIALWAGNLLRARIDSFISDLDLDVWVCLDVVVPIRIGIGSSL